MKAFGDLFAMLILGAYLLFLSAMVWEGHRYDITVWASLAEPVVAVKIPVASIPGRDPNFSQHLKDAANDYYANRSLPDVIQDAFEDGIAQAQGR